MLIVHGTRKFLSRVGKPTASPEAASTTSLGSWYATALFWRPQLALFVNELTLLPLLVPLAPAARVVGRFTDALGESLRRHGASERCIEAEAANMAEHRLAATSNRSVVGVMTEFVRLAEIYRAEAETDLGALVEWLEQTPCGPLCGRHVSPDRELVATLAALQA